VNIPPPPNIITILDVHGSVLHKDSEEAKKQLSGKLLGINDVSFYTIYKLKSFPHKIFT
jgi:hypothetical protein